MEGGRKDCAATFSVLLFGGVGLRCVCVTSTPQFYSLPQSPPARYGSVNLAKSPKTQYTVRIKSGTRTEVFRPHSPHALSLRFGSISSPPLVSSIRGRFLPPAPASRLRPCTVPIHPILMNNSFSLVVPPSYRIELQAYTRDLKSGIDLVLDEGSPFSGAGANSV